MNSSSIITAVVFAVFFLSLSAETRLRVGHAHSPAEAKAELADLKKSYPDLPAWQKRKKRLLNGILKGAKLTQLPVKTPLNPKHSNKRNIEATLLKVSPLKVHRVSLLREHFMSRLKNLSLMRACFARMVMAVGLKRVDRRGALPLHGWELRCFFMTWSVMETGKKRDGIIARHRKC